MDNALGRTGESRIPTGIKWKNDRLQILDQTKLPAREVWIDITGAAEAAEAIRTLRIRGAPAIAIIAGYALYLELRKNQPQDSPSRTASAMGEYSRVRDLLLSTRPTAVNLRNALVRMDARVHSCEEGGPGIEDAVRDEAEKLHKEDAALCEKMSRAAQELIPMNARILTHCNTGALATGGIGTAVGAFYTAYAQGKNISVYAGETRPLLQGARITAWELQRAGIQVTLIADSTASFVMERNGIDLVMVGADRIARNGDTANKIGTMGLAILARHFKIPFYVVAPETTLDRTIADGGSIPIEERDPQEVRSFMGVASTPDDIPVLNPAFDITPAALISGIVTENGVFRYPYNF